MLADSEMEKLARRVGDLLANDHEFTAALSSAEVAKSMLQSGLGLADVMREVADGYVDRPALGQRATTVRESADGSGRVLEILPRFDMVTYGELWRRAH